MAGHKPTATEGGAESELHTAAWNGNLEEVKSIVAKGVDVNWIDSAGESAVFGAAAWGHSEVVAYLLLVGARIDFHEPLSGFTPLHWAAKSNIETIQTLVNAGADASAPDKFGRLPVDIAHESGKGEHVAYLKTIGPEIESRRKKGSPK